MYTYKETKIGSVLKSYMRKGFLRYEEMRKDLIIYVEPLVIYCMTLQPITSEFI